MIGPSYFNPRRYKERAMERRDLVLRLMAEDGLISARNYKLALERDIVLAPLSRFDINQHPGYMELVRRELNTLLSNQRTLMEALSIHLF